jgi:hypothetical protein
MSTASAKSARKPAGSAAAVVRVISSSPRVHRNLLGQRAPADLASAHQEHGGAVCERVGDERRRVACVQLRSSIDATYRPPAGATVAAC